MRALGIERVMLAGSDLPRGAGVTAAAIRTTQFMKALDRNAYAAFYYGSGCTPGRSGWGHSPSLLRTWAGHFGDIRQRQFTLQGPQHRILFGNDAVGADALRSIRHAMTKPQAVATEEQIAAVEKIFAGLIEREQRQRNPDSAFAQFIERHKDTLLKMRNAMAVSGSRDRQIPPHAYTHVFEDRAINADFLQRFFRMVDGFAWADLDAKTMAPQVAAVKEELAGGNPLGGNPLMRQVLVRMALMSVELYAPDACREIWESAGFVPDEIGTLESARRNRLAFLDACGYSLRDNADLQRMVSESIGSPWHGDAALERNFKEIVRRLKAASLQASTALAMPVPDRTRIAKGMVFTPYKSFGTSQK